MKTKLPLISLILLCGVLIGAAFGPQRIRWNWPKENSAAILEVKYNGQLLQVGLRDDGVVVWREITTTTNVIVTTTNSPAERQDSGVMILTNLTLPYYQWTNTIPFESWMTNYHQYYSTNSIIPL